MSELSELEKEIVNKINFPIHYNPRNLEIIDDSGVILLDVKSLPLSKSRNTDILSLDEMRDIMGKMFVKSFNEKYANTNVDKG